GVLPGEVREQLLDGWNNTTRAVPRATLPELFAEQVARTPYAVAVVSDNEDVTYAELDARASRLAAVLATHGVGPESVVAVVLERSVDLVVALLAVLKT